MEAAMKRFSLFLLYILSTTTFAETFTYVVPAGASGGNAKWAQHFTKQWDKKLNKHGHSIVIRYVPGQHGRKGFAKWATEMSDKDNVVMQTQGLINYLTTKRGWKGFNPEDVEYIGGQLQGTFVFKKTDVTPGIDNVAIHIDGGAEVIVDAMGSSMMMCGNQSVDYIIACANRDTRWVRGFKGSGQRRQAYLNNQIQVTRDGFPQSNKSYKKELKSGKSEIWYSHGSVDMFGNIHPDANSVSTWFNDKFKERWGEAPKGRYFDAYQHLIKMRSGIGKVVFTKKNNKHYNILLKTMNDVIKDKKAMKKLTKKLGVYEWHTGQVTDAIVKSILSSLNRSVYKDIVKIRRSFGEKTDFREELVGRENWN